VEKKPAVTSSSTCSNLLLLFALIKDRSPRSLQHFVKTTLQKAYTSCILLAQNSFQATTQERLHQSTEMNRKVELLGEEEKESCHTAVDRIPTTPKTLVMPPSRKQV